MIETTLYVKKRQMEEKLKKFKSEVTKNKNVLGKTKSEQKAATEYYQANKRYVMEKNKDTPSKQVYRRKKK